MCLLNVGKKENSVAGIPVSAEARWISSSKSSLNVFTALFLWSLCHMDLGACVLRNKNSNSSLQGREWHKYVQRRAISVTS